MTNSYKIFILVPELHINDFVMKNLIVVPFVFLFLLVACSKNSIDDPALPEDSLIKPIPRIETVNTILLLKIDYLTYKFEGGAEKLISGGLANTDSIPIEIVYKSPSDLGRISLFYKPTNDLLFDGIMLWASSGVKGLIVPAKFNVPETYFKTIIEPALPDDSRFQKIFPDTDFNYSKLWKSISNLCIVTEYLQCNKKIGLLLYMPSVGVGDPHDWDWFVIMSK